MANKICVRCGMEYPGHKMSCKIPVEEWRLPTAEEFLDNGDFHSHTDDSNDKVFYQNLVQEAMIEFAKLHCEAQSKAILKEVEQEIACDAYSTEHFNLSVKPSILNAYPLDLIR